jgi:hypothetical protein
VNFPPRRPGSEKRKRSLHRWVVLVLAFVLYTPSICVRWYLLPHAFLTAVKCMDLVAAHSRLHLLCVRVATDHDWTKHVVAYVLICVSVRKVHEQRRSLTHWSPGKLVLPAGPTEQHARHRPVPTRASIPGRTRAHGIRSAARTFCVLLPGRATVLEHCCGRVCCSVKLPLLVEFK